MEKQTIIFNIVSPKKNSVRYDTKEPDVAVTTIYIMRTALGAVIPKKIKITLEEVS